MEKIVNSAVVLTGLSLSWATPNAITNIEAPLKIQQSFFRLIVWGIITILQVAI